ncbi:Cell wall biogenesis protein [Gammaproteobacteria bacterium]
MNNNIRNIPFFDYKIFATKYGEALMDTLRDVISRGAYIAQKDLLDFEAEIAKYLNVKHAIGVANCTDGLMLALRAAGIKEGDEVILPSHTFVATAASVHFLGAVPILVECGRDHMIDPDAFEKAITNRTKAVMPVQLNGRTCDMDRIMSIAKKYNLLIVEDAAQGLGSSFKDKKAGSFGLAAAFSFYPAKILGCLGDGGMVVTNDDKVAEQVLLMRDHGRNHDGLVVTWGLNSRLDNLQAAALRLFFSHYDETVARRRHLAMIYQTKLNDIKELVLPPAPNSDPNHFDVYQNYEIEAERRDGLQDYLKSVGIGTIRQWGGTTVHQFDKLGFKKNLPFTEAMISKELMLPINLSLSDDDVEYICGYIRKFYSK